MKMFKNACESLLSNILHIFSLGIKQLCKKGGTRHKDFV